MILVTVVAVALFGVPLAIAAKSLYRSQEVGRLQAEATLAAGPLPSFRPSGNQTVRPSGANGQDLAFYDEYARLVSGVGPAKGGKAVKKALAGQIDETERRGTLRVAVPILSDNRVYGAVEASSPLSAIDRRAHRTWLAMAGLGIVVVLVATGFARRQAQRLAEPIVDLSEVLARLGQGDFAIRLRHYGIGEMDAAAEALDATATRLGAVLARERAFSANVSHQLSTPLTGLRLTLESALLTPGADLSCAVQEALGEVARLQGTVAELLALARNVKRSPNPMDIGQVFLGADKSWSAPLAKKRRALKITVPPDLPAVYCSTAAVREILDVLVANATRHGAGTVTVRAHGAGEGLVLEVADEGPGVSGDTDDLFERQPVSGKGHGIGLALARSLAEAEGGRLLLRAPGPYPVFALVLSGGRPADSTFNEAEPKVLAAAAGPGHPVQRVPSTGPP